MMSVQEELLGEIFSLRDFPNGLPRRIKESVEEFFTQMDFPDELPGRIFLTDRVRAMCLGKESQDVMSFSAISMAPNMQHQMIGNN